MEVHHHPDLHHKRKNFSEYFLEFLMIFLAVTMGFFAESLRESLMNSEKEKHYIQNLVADLKKDTADIAYQLKVQQLQVNNMDSALKISVERLQNFNSQDSFYHQFLPFYSLLEFFTSNDNTISQLKAGGFNMIRKENVVDSITSLYSSYEAIQLGNEFLKIGYWDIIHTGQQILKLPPPATSLDDPILNKIPENKEIFTQHDKHLIQQLYNVIGNEKGSVLTYIFSEKQYQAKAKQLISYLEKQYDLK